MIGNSRSWLIYLSSDHTKKFPFSLWAPYNWRWDFISEVGASKQLMTWSLYLANKNANSRKITTKQLLYCSSSSLTLVTWCKWLTTKCLVMATVSLATFLFKFLRQTKVKMSFEGFDLSYPFDNLNKISRRTYCGKVQPLDKCSLLSFCVFRHIFNFPIQLHKFIYHSSPIIECALCTNKRTKTNWKINHWKFMWKFQFIDERWMEMSISQFWSVIFMRDLSKSENLGQWVAWKAVATASIFEQVDL